MTAEPARLTRRILLSGASGLAVWPRPGQAAANLLSEGAAMLIAGPDGGRLDQVSQALAPALARALPPGTALKRVITGAADGVTVANQFDARIPPDGHTVLMVPGAAALAWLSGDMRVHFEAARWVAVMAGFTPAVMVGRLPPGGRAPGAAWRVAAVDQAGLALPALLAVDLVGAQCIPVTGLADDAAASAALARGEVDVVLVRGPDVSSKLAVLDAIGVQRLFVLGTPDEGGGVGRDPMLPEVPDMAEFCARLRGARPSGPLYAAWRGVAAAAQLEFAVVLPQLTTAALVAVWRRAAAQAASASDLLAAASGAFRPLTSAAATASIGAISADAPAMLELRRWLAVRLNWLPG